MNDIYVGQLFSDSYLEHYGVLGMKWGVRRYQNADGTLTSSGKKRYSSDAKQDAGARKKKILRTAAGVALAAGTAYAGYKMYKNGTDPSKIAARAASKAMRTARKEAVKKMKDTVKNRHTLSEEELDKALSRVKKELELKRVTEENLSSGRSEVDSIIRSSGKKVAGTVLTGSMLYGIKYGLTGKFDAKDAANYVTPRPKQK